MKIKLAFETWQDKVGFDIYNTERGIELSSGDFHSGTVFEAEIKIDSATESELREALASGARPVFVVYKEGES